jgi:hypothetical protein
MDSSMTRATRVLLGLLGISFVVSVIHYTDNYVSDDGYPQPGPDDPPAPSADSPVRLRTG